MSSVHLPYFFNSSNRAKYAAKLPAFYRILGDQAELDKYGRLPVDQDPGLQSKKTIVQQNDPSQPKFRQVLAHELSDEQAAVMDQEALDSKSYDDNIHLPKGLFLAAGETEIDPKKENLVVSVIEDDFTYLESLLKQLKLYFRTSSEKARSIRDRFNIQVLWATSIEDSLKVLNKAGEKIKTAADSAGKHLKHGLEKAKLLFLNDMNFFMGTGPNFTNLEGEKNIGEAIVSKVKEVFAVEDKNIGELRQTSAIDLHSKLEYLASNTTKWEGLNYDEDNYSDAVDELASRFAANEVTTVAKLAKVTQLEEHSIKGAAIPVEAFVQSLAS